MSDPQDPGATDEVVIDQSAERDENDVLLRDLVKRLSEPGALLELKRKAAQSNDPSLHALALELDSLINMSPTRRIMGHVMMLPDHRYPSSEITKEALSLIETAMAKTGHRGDPAGVWTGLLDHYKWHRKKKFLAASIAHCIWFTGWLLEQGRDDDARFFKQLAIDLTSLKKKEKMRRRTREGQSRLQNRVLNGVVPPLTKPKARLGRRRLQKDPLVPVKAMIIEMKQCKASQLDICRRLGNRPRPPHAGWKDLTWQAAYLDPTHRPAVKSWISRI